MKTIAKMLLVSAALALGNVTSARAQEGKLVWDAISKEYTSKPGERYAEFKFWFTNNSPEEVYIMRAQSSCFCTVAQLPQTPWRIPPGTNGSIDVKMDLAGKSGTVSKGVNVDTTGGSYALSVQTTITPATTTPGMADADRLRNMQTALADRQAIFTKAECVSCHADPAKGVMDGAKLYTGVCGVCHDSQHRASTVPDLRKLNHPTDPEHWHQWITHGRAGTMMPAFTKTEGGPLDEQQIEAIVAHLVRTIPSRGTQIK